MTDPIEAAANRIIANKQGYHLDADDKVVARALLEAKADHEKEYRLRRKWEVRASNAEVFSSNMTHKWHHEREAWRKLACQDCMAQIFPLLVTGLPPCKAEAQVASLAKALREIGDHNTRNYVWMRNRAKDALADLEAAKSDVMT